MAGAGSEGRIVNRTNSLDFRGPSGNQGVAWNGGGAQVDFRKAPWPLRPPRWLLIPSALPGAGMGREGRTRDPVAWSGGWQAFPVEGWSVVILGLRVPWTLSQLFISAVVAESSR